ncbi:MAG: cytochrome o ubiquinol oxidase subunit IV [Methylotetracoccus sp.]
MEASATAHTVRLADYLTGFVLAVVLTVIPFGVVAAKALPAAAMHGLIVTCAIAQVLVHLRYFLHLGFSRGNAWLMISLVFTFVIGALMVGGTLWIMYDLNAEMMLKP